MDKEALCKAEINEQKINHLISEIVQLRFRIEEVQREKYIDVQRLYTENTHLRVEMAALKKQIVEGLKELNQNETNEGSTQEQKTSVKTILKRSEKVAQSENETNT